MSALTAPAEVGNTNSATDAGEARRVRPGVRASIRLAALDIKLAHSVFALPFAVLGAFLARGDGPGPGAGAGWSVFGVQLGLVVVCMVLARTWAMLVNRLADARLDALNPRTQQRAVASGRLPARAAGWIAAGCAAGFIAAAGLFWPLAGNAWPLGLSVPVLAWLAFYSFAKRFTWLCHALLGTALAISPLAAALAVDPAAISRVSALWWLSGMVVCWVAGFDVIYALQDVEVDRRLGLFSVPARLGIGRALWLSRVLHAGAAACLLMAWRSDTRFGVVFLAAVAIAAALLAVEHIVLAKRGEKGLDMAFFTLNGIVSCVVGGLGVVSLLAGR